MQLGGGMALGARALVMQLLAALSAALDGGGCGSWGLRRWGARSCRRAIVRRLNREKNRGGAVVRELNNGMFRAVRCLLFARHQLKCSRYRVEDDRSVSIVKAISGTGINLEAFVFN